MTEGKIPTLGFGAGAIGFVVLLGFSQHIGVITPATTDYIVMMPADDHLVLMPADDHVLMIPADERSVRMPADDQIVEMPPDDDEVLM
jgi:hypothetical protein